MIRNPEPVALVSPKGIDKAIKGVNDLLLSKLGWLDYAYGKADKLVEEVDGRAKRYPAIYLGSNRKLEYLNLLPDSHLGNYSWVDVEDGYDIEWREGEFDVLQEANCSWVFWFDIEKVYPADSDQRTVRNVLDDILLALRTGQGVDVRKVYERGENVFRGYDINEVKRKFMMRPFGAIRIECRLSFLNC